MSKTVCAALAGMLALSAVTGCGRTLAPAAAVRLAGLARAHDTGAPAGPFARQFYDQVKPHFTGSVELDGDVVTLAGDPGAGDAAATRYDFGTTATTHQVAVHTAAFDTTVDFDALMQSFTDDGTDKEILPLLLLPIAIQLSAAAVQSFAIYWISHHGDQFDRSECIKAMVVGMGVALIPFVGEVKYARHLVPIATKILAAAPGLTVADIARAALPMLGEIVMAIRAMLKERKEAAPAG